MRHLQDSARCGAATPLVMNDLCAQIAPLNRYGLPGVGAALATALRALTGASRSVLCAAAGCERA